ncbi:hypothetical protein C8R45DRAFT_1157637 [Mycena sanguinolenta]|nr:hypothetical protein C8R45DRAFT_1157637 [Mycena sanguinolenta]
MPRPPTIIEIRLKNLADCLASTLEVLNELNDAFAPSFIQPISSTVASLLKHVQNIKQNKKECARLLENIYQVISEIINLHIKSEVAGSLSPAMTEQVGRFMKTLHKIFIYVEAQQDGNKIKQLFRSNEAHKLLKDCEKELDEAKKVFEVGASGALFKNIGEMKSATITRHKEILELISTISETNTTMDDSSVHLGANELENSSNSFSLLPSKPKIFYGRETELEKIIQMLAQPSPRIAILGGGGMGKTSLARAALHHQDTLARFEQRFFVSAEPATTSVELAALIGLHIGLNPGKDLTKAVVQYFLKELILDNLETVWGPIQSRARVEEFLSLLTDVQHLGLIITMRGAERPARVQWSHPFLSPLQPLSDHAAKQTFVDITDNSCSAEDFNQLLSFTDNLPLAVDLLAHLVDCEGLEHVLAQWQTEKTAMLCVGYDRKSNLDASINLSLSSPRITSESKELLSLLSILPNGLSDAELIQSNLPISNILSCKAALLATSLAHVNSNKRLLVLVPVREHIQQSSPPSPSLVYCLQKHFHALFKLFNNHRGEQWQPTIKQITLNLGNLQEVLQRSLDVDHSELADTVQCIIYLSNFYRLTGQGGTSLTGQIRHILPKITDHRIHIQFMTEVLGSEDNPTLPMEKVMTEGISHFKHINDPLLESSVYTSKKSNLKNALQLLSKAQESSQLSGDITQQYRVFLRIAVLQELSGNYAIAEKYTYKAQQLSELSADLYHSASALSTLAKCSTIMGNYCKSMIQVDQAKELLEICGMSGGVLDCQVRLQQAKIHLLKSEYTKAQSKFSDIGQTAFQTQQLTQYANASLNIAYIDIQIGAATADIWKNLSTAGKIYRSRDSYYESVAKMFEACMYLKENTFELARLAFQECLHTPITDRQSFCLEHLANIKAWPTTIEQSSWPMIYLGFAYKVKEKLALHKALLFVGDVFIASQDESTAFVLYTVALEGFKHMDVHQKQAECMLRLGDLAHAHGNTLAAIAHWKTARLLFERSSQMKDIAQIDSKLAAIEKAHEKALITLATLEAPHQQLHMLPGSKEESPDAVLV